MAISGYRMPAPGFPINAALATARVLAWASSTLNPTRPINWLLARADLDQPDLAPFRAQLDPWFAKHGAEAVLVRPDRFVFGTGEPAVLAAAWAAQLAA
jgi:hypothetical protein